MRWVWLFLLGVFLVFLESKKNNVVIRPVIGIVTQPSEGTHYSMFGKSIINADYVKWVEMSGGLVVPIHYESKITEIDDVFKKINGILFPGGETSLNGTSYYETLAYLFEKAVQANENGDYFPIWGTCLGFEFLNMAVAKSIDVLDTFDAENISLPVHFEGAAMQSRMFNFQSAFERNSLLNFMSNFNATENLHVYGVSPQQFNGYSLLASFYDVIGLSFDRNNKAFVSIIESKKYPIYGTQFHPERNLFEWTPFENIDHSSNSVAMSQYFSRFFVNEARKNYHTFTSSEELMSLLIYNAREVYTYPLQDLSMQYYTFN